MATDNNPAVAGPKRRARKPAAGEPKPQWAVLRGKELHWPGAPLLALLLEAGHTRGLSIRELAEKHLGITHSHFLLLRKGKRSIPKLGDDTMDKIAEFLGLPRVMVMLAAGQLKPEHFYQQPQMMNQYVERALKFIQTDPEFGHQMPPELFTQSLDVRRFVILLYEKATKQTVLPPRETLGSIVEAYQTIDTPRHRSSEGGGHRRGGSEKLP